MAILAKEEKVILENSGESGGIMEDLERLSAELQSLQKDSETRNNLLKIVAHDLLSPATSISGLAKLLLKREDAAGFTERQLKILQTMDRAMDQYLVVLCNIMELSKIVRNRIDIQPQRIKLAPFLERIVGSYSQRASQKGIALEYAFIGEDEILADDDKTEQTVRRLMDNAIMFTNRGGKVWASCIRNGGRMVVEISDTGVGIEIRRLDSIFMVDEKNHTFGTEGERGSGMSLCIAKRIARLNGGDLEIISEEGKGTTVRLSLPVPD